MVGDDKCLWCGGPAHGVNFHKTFCSTKCKSEYSDYQTKLKESKKTKTNNVVNDNGESSESNYETTGSKSFLVGIIAYGSVAAGIYTIVQGEIIIGIVLIIFSALINWLFHSRTGRKF
jgi:hypothetical protein